MAKKKKANKSGKKSKKAKRVVPARKKKVMKKTAKRTKRKLKNKRLFMSKPTPAPVVAPAAPGAPLLFGGYFGNKTEDQ
jgi:hypothetical protein